MYLKNELYELIRTDETIFDFIQESSLDGLWYWDLEDTENEWMNAKFWTVLGYNPEEMPHKSTAWQNIINQDDLKLATENFIQHCKDPNHPYDQIVRYAHKDGSTVWIRCRGLAIRDKDGKPIRMLGAHHDITDIIKSEQALIKAKEKAEVNEERFQLAMSASNDGIFDWNLETNEIYYSPSWKRMLGYEDHELPNDFSVWENNTDPSDVKKSWELQQKLVSKQVDRFVLEFKMKHKNGHWVYILSRAEAIFNDKGKAIRIVGTHKDVTQRKRYEAELLASENRHKAAQKLGNVGNWEYDMKTGLFWGSDEAKRIYGFNPEQDNFTTEAVESCIPERDRVHQALIDLIEKGKEYKLEFEIFPVNSTQPRTIISIAELLKDDKGQPISVHGVIQDITARKHAELLLQQNNEEIAAQNEELYQTNLELIEAKEKAEESEAQFRNLFENSADAIFIAETETGIILDANQAAERLTKMGRHEIIGLHQTRLHPPQSVNYSIETFVQHQKLSEEHKTTKPLENIVIRKDGTQIPVEITATKVVYEGKNCLVGNFRDISERKRIELELAESEQRFKALHNASFGGIAIHDKGVILDCNQGLSEMTGYSLDELIGMDGLLLIDPEHRAMVLNNIVSGFEKPYEANGLRKNGQTFPMRLEARNVPYRGKMVRTVEFRDITEGKQAEEALRKSEERFRRLAENAQDLIYRYEFSPKRGFSYVSPAALTITGYTPQEHYADPDLGFKMVHPDDHHLLVAEVNHNEETIRKPLVLRWIRKDGSVLWTEQRNVPIYNEKGTLIAIEGIAIDITDQKNTEQLLQEKGEEIAVQNEELNQANLELISAKDKAEASDRLKSAFLANMSHEIRTPMNGILGFAELLKEPNLTGEEQQSYINIIEKSGRRMLNIINQIIDISKIEAGLMEINLKESCINEQLDYIYTFFKPETEAKKIKLTLKNTLPLKDSIIKTDREKVYAILTNLVKNAIKYTHQGTIELGYESVETYVGTSLRFYVSDTGIGIPKDRQEAIFERFVQADIADTMARQGAGLGLTISKAYVEMLGGRIWVDSEEGKGSTFYFTLPYDAGQPLPETCNHGQHPATNNHDVPKLKILLAEDDRVSEMLIDKYIKLFGKEILKVKTGLEAVEICRNNPDIDLILMDIRMPEMGGYEATRQIRVFNKEVIIIAQTAHGLAGDRSKALEAGCNDYIAKPIIKSELLALIQKCFGK